MTTEPVQIPDHLADEPEPIHAHFGLTYANYLVMPRTLLQSMPVEWQRPFVALLEQFDAAFAHVERARCYDVTAGVEREIGDLSNAEMKVLGVQSPEGEPSLDENEDAYERWRQDARWLYRGDEYESWERIVFPTPDPVPHYQRGRARVEPRMTGAAR